MTLLKKDVSTRAGFTSSTWNEPPAVIVRTKKKNHGMWGYFGDWLSAPDAVVQVLQHSPDSRSVLSKRQVNMAETSIKVTHEPVLDH
jgi:hypothetical protein